MSENRDGPDSSGEHQAFDQLIRSRRVTDDQELADLIESHGRSTLNEGRPVELDVYLRAVPDLKDRPDALDAAIDIALRSLAGGAAITNEAVDQLIRRHPDIEEPIREAAVLGESILATTDVRAALAGPRARSLPADFGPRMEDGRLRYELIELLGRGAFGEVYKAIDRHLSEPDKPALVAIKLLALGAQSRWARQRFIEEATKARRIDHPNVVRVFDRGVTEKGDDYIVQEYVSGGDLANHPATRDRPLAARDAARIMLELARGVQAAHSAALIHCDLKPSNILMTGDGEPKVGDFGIAIKAGDGEQRQRDFERERPLGNLAFMSPEQFRREDGSLNAASDIYALGGILYWLLSDRLPNGDSSESIERRHGENRSASAAAGLSVDRDLRMICARALASDRADRYTSAGAFATDLHAWLEKEPIRWTRPSPIRITRLWMRRRPAVALLSVLVALTLVTGGATAFRLQSIASQRAIEAQEKEMEAEIARVRADEERKWRERIHMAFQRNRNALLYATDPGFKTQALSILWAIDWMVGGGLFEHPEIQEFVWENRVQTVRELIDERRDRSGPEAVELLLWESALAFWLAMEGEYEESEPLAASLVDRWSRLTTEDDPWLDQVRSIAAAARINRIAARSSEGAMTEQRRETLLAATDLLHRVWNATSHYEDAGPMRTLIGRSLHKAFQPALLDRPEQAEAIWAELERIKAIEVDGPTAASGDAKDAGAETSESEPTEPAPSK